MERQGGDWRGKQTAETLRRNRLFRLFPRLTIAWHPLPAEKSLATSCLFDVCGCGVVLNAGDVPAEHVEIHRRRF